MVKRIRISIPARRNLKLTPMRVLLFAVSIVLLLTSVHPAVVAQMGTATPLPPKEREKAAAENKASGVLPNYPTLVDITPSTGIHFEHSSSPEAKFIVESMSGGVA